MTDTIVAVATAAGRGGVAIVRLSGNPIPIAEKMFKPSGKTSVAEFESYKMYTGKIDCGAFTDFGLCVLFRAPRSFTGEDVVEFHCHGGVQIARGIVQKAISLGARLAERGEYTKRAFLNGKLSLSSAEGMVDMINGESEAEVRAGFALYGETLTKKVRLLQDSLTTVLAGIDCDIDYPEEDLEFASEDTIRNELRKIDLELDRLLSGYAVGKKIKQGVTVVIAGRPNAGKSSLLNVLLGYDRAIVSSIPGTTRDSIEGSIEIEGIRFNLIDTAGLRESEDEIERIGVTRAERLVQSADVLLYLFESWTEDDEAFLQGRTSPVVLVRTKADKGGEGQADLVISSVSGEGIKELKKVLYEKGVGQSNDGAFLVEQRHYESLRKAKESIFDALCNLGFVPLDMIAVDLRNVWEALGEITGETASETVINEIFAKFCVGK